MYVPFFIDDVLVLVRVCVCVCVRALLRIITPFVKQKLSAFFFFFFFFPALLFSLVRVCKPVALSVCVCERESLVFPFFLCVFSSTSSYVWWIWRSITFCVVLLLCNTALKSAASARNGRHAIYVWIQAPLGIGDQLLRNSPSPSPSLPLYVAFCC
ncbi:hypothetical protein ABB37_08596 [Leptomonas pyrrhocoris]|uniref:Transmembrane protein n=1 Tax=Leptomonas pyrrhocoris TaxID=157538 RepID=A0A0M9FT29_LEPPY|nr:hypothetical protein ABB37_08596 [Leptomonas pyrrhocoris]KPA75296.1 hypothetical protein ABB37_08596 [Leptomonas pyrrhocoris]|eukprot:XP_015653735.1 hypothetical protein ABB37_08596 [Leptomonas pyrrhocoris]